MSVQFLSVCSGIEAASVAWEPLGWKALAFSEIEPFPRAVLAHHYPDVPLHGDFTVLRDEPWIVGADLLCGGTPCQAFSIAGLRQSLSDERGNLTLEFVRLLDAIDDLRLSAGREPAVCFWENVPGVLSTRDNAFGCFLAALVGEDAPLVPGRGQKWTDAGLVVGPRRTAAWRTLDAQYFGLAQRRRRVFVVASARDGFDPAEVLFERQGVQGNPPPRRVEGEGVAPTISARTKGGGGLGTDFDCDGGLIQAFGGNNTSGAIDVAAALSSHGGPHGRQDFASETFICDPVAYDLRNGTADHVTQTLNAGGMGDARGVCPNAIPHVYSIMPQNSGKDYKARAVEVAQPLMAGGPVGGNQGGDFFVQAVPFDTTQITSSANYSNPKPGDPCHPLAAGAHAPAVAFALRGRDGGAMPEIEGDGQSVGTLRAANGGSSRDYVAFQTRGSNIDLGQDVTGTIGTGCDRASGSAPMIAASAVRRLTPVECERLQGFPDGYTDVPWRGKPTAPDGPRYKALGNSWAVPVVRWIGTRLDAQLKAVADQVGDAA